jgi:hypothetical protein
MLHLPYTSMVLSFVVVGAVVSTKFSGPVLLATLGAYFLALGIGAHFLDQLPGMGSRYVRHWSSSALWIVGLTGVAGGVAVGVVGAFMLLGLPFLILVVIQGICAVGYPLAPIFGGLLHRDSVFAISWGSLPFLTSYFAQSGQVTAVSLILAGVFAVVAVVEIRVSRRSRGFRRKAQVGTTTAAAAPIPVTSAFRQPDRILEGLSLGTTLLAIAMLAIRVIPGG